MYVGSGRVAGADCDSIKEGFDVFRTCMAVEGCCEELFEKKTMAEYLKNISAEILKETTRNRNICRFTKLPSECSAPDYSSLMMAFIGGVFFVVWNFAALFCHRRAKRQHAPHRPELGITSLLCFFTGAPIACCFPIDGPGSEIIASMRRQALGDGQSFEAQGIAEPGHWGFGRFMLYPRRGEVIIRSASTSKSSTAPKQHTEMSDARTLTGRTLTGRTLTETSAEGSEEDLQPYLGPRQFSKTVQKERQIASSAAARAFYEREEREAREAAEAAARGKSPEEVAFDNFVNDRRASKAGLGLPGEMP